VYPDPTQPTMDACNVARTASVLHSLPDVFYRLVTLLQDPDTTNDELASVIEHDVGLTARLLQLANSAYFARPVRIDRVSVALSLLGRSALRDLLIATTVVETFRGLPEELVDMVAFWYHSVYTGMAARQLAGRCNVLHAERLFVAGMLHDIGHLAMYSACPEAMTRALEQAPFTDHGLYRVERDLLGFTHATVGAQMLRNWRMAEGLVDVAAWHHEPRRSASHELDVAIVHLANAVANQVEAGRNVDGVCETEIDPYAWQLTGLDPSVSEQVLVECDQHITEVFGIVTSGMLVY
jgi:putative nucleotidyltransferase with HDIG domain